MGVGEPGMRAESAHWAATPVAQGWVRFTAVPGGGTLSETPDTEGVQSTWAAGFSAQLP
ncbi:hypothetical protein GCM10009825_32870 [Arthrobacter humicola]|uniref:Uncharacterized protein n=1 Tax=Arthrobacter humicola TaxID=409291 RepID=A0ABN2ZIZ5_9MICC